MPVITDNEGTREVSDAQLDAIRVEADQNWSAFFASRTWQPIAKYDRDAGDVALLRRGDEWAAGYWGASAPDLGDAAADHAPAWRHAQDAIADLPLGFEPTEFAAVADDEREMVMAD